MTFKELYKEWKEYKASFIKQTSMSGYSLIFRNHISPHFGDVDISKLNRKEIQLFYNNLRQSQVLSTKSSLDVMIVVKMLLKYAFQEEYISAFSLKIDYPSVNMERKQEIEVYTVDEQRKILQCVVDNLTNRSLGIMIALCSGMRIGELCALQWKHIDVDNKMLHICSTLTRVYDINEDWEEGVDEFGKRNRKGKSSLLTSYPKTQSSTRDIPIVKELLEILKPLRKISNPEFYVLSGERKPTEPRTYRSFYFKYLKEDVKLTRVIKFHGLRHSFATRMIESGADVKTTSIILGHTDVSTTMNLYMHPTSENKASVMSKSVRKLFN